MIYLNKAEITDGEFILSVRNDSSTLCFLHDSRAFKFKDFQIWFKNTNPVWYIILNEEKEPVGYVRTKWIDKMNNLQIGVDIHPSHRRKGYAKAAYQNIFEMYNYVKIFSLEVFEDNKLAIDLYEKLGFSEVNRYLYTDGISSRNSIVMKKTNE
jgi:ribosomal protein S18 acetylase RimI-like enzyme